MRVPGWLKTAGALLFEFSLLGLASRWGWKGVAVCFTLAVLFTLLRFNWGV